MVGDVTNPLPLLWGDYCKSEKANNMSNTIKNASTFGSTVLSLAVMKGQSDTGPLLLIKDNEQDVANLAARVQDARDQKKQGKEASERDTVLSFWRATPAGETFMSRKAAAEARRKATKGKEDAEAFAEFTKQETSINTMLIRTVDCFEGIQALRRNGRTVHLRNVKGQKAVACFSMNPAADEIELIRFGIAPLINVVKADFTAKTPTSELLAAARKAGGSAPSEPGAGNRLVHGALSSAIVTVDDSITALVDSNTGKIAAGPKVQASALALWARLDAMLSDDDKAKARAAFAADAAPKNGVDAGKAKAAGRPRKAAAKSSLVEGESANRTIAKAIAKATAA